MLAFSAATRRRDLERMGEDRFDLLVIGGGITGCGIALDAASRGLSVALVERDDFAAGTSGRSSRLVHGGVRYLEHYDFALVHEALRERAVLLRLAPHLVRPLPMFAPLPRLRRRMEWRLGLVVYDALALGRNIGWHRHASEAEVRRAVPGLGYDSRGLRYHEARTDDARLTIEVARTAHAFGARMANHAEATDLLGGSRVVGAVVTDRIGGGSIEVRARLTVNAAGVWADRVQAMADSGTGRLRPSKGVHLVFRPGAVATRVGLIVPTAANDGRFIFVVPWGGRVYAGTTDTPYDGDLDAPAVTPADRDYVLAAVAAAFPGVTEADVVSSWAGLRPLLGRGDGSTADLSRRHAIYEEPRGLLTITGGKLTTYRDMAEDLVNRAASALGVPSASRTRAIPLGLRRPLDAALDAAAGRARRLGLAPEAGRRLVFRFGDDWEEACRLIEADPSLGRPAVEGLPVLAVEVELAASREMALTDDDVLVRRTRLTTLDAKAGRLPAR